MIAVAGEMGAAQTPEAEFGHRSAGLWPSFAREIETASGQQIGYRVSGALFVARTSSDLAGYENWTGVERLDSAAACAREPLLGTRHRRCLLAPDEVRRSTRARSA